MKPFFSPIVSLLLAVFLAASASAAESPDPENPEPEKSEEAAPAKATGKVEGTSPAERLDAVLAEIDLLAERALAETGVPGLAVIVVFDGKVVHTKGFGVREAGKELLVDENTVFQVASVSKPVATTVVAALVGEEGVSWDDPVRKYLPDFEMHDPWVSDHVTLRDFFCHRSGLPDHAADELETVGFDQAEILKKLRFFLLENRFRAAYAYTNFGFTAAAEAAAKAAGKSWGELAQEKLFTPLGMSHSSYRFEDYAKAENRALGHARSEGEWAPGELRNADAQAPAGGLSTNAKDLSQWMLLQLAQGRHGETQVVTEDALWETHKPHMLTDFHPNNGKAGFYGLGWGIGSDAEGRVFLRHSGEFSLGARSIVSLFPAGKTGIAVLVNAAANGIPEGLAFSFYDLLLEGELSRDWVTFANERFGEMVKEQLAGDGVDYSAPPAEPKPRQALRHYTGDYQNAFYGPVNLVRVGERLILRMGPADRLYELHHYNGDTFFFETDGETAEGASGVVFDIEPGQAAKGFTIHLLNQEGLGYFAR